MGGTESKIKSLYNLNEIVAEGFFLNHYNATMKETGVAVSAFVGKDGIVADNYDLLQKAIQKMKTIRHPGIITSIIASGIVKYLKADIDKTEIFIVTEHVIPLSNLLSKLGPDKICIGIHSLVKTVHFLHANSIVHNNLSLSSIYVTVDGRWVLGGMEFIKDFSDVTSDFIDIVDKYIPKDSIPPEDSDKSLESTFIESRDYYALGHVLSRIIAPFISPSYIHVSDTEKFAWRDLQDLLDNMLVRNPDSRYSTKLLIEASFFKDNVLIDVVETFHGLVNIPVDIKARMFNQLAMKLRCLSSFAVSEIILPLILVLENFSEPGSESIFRELFGIKWNNQPLSKATVQRKSYTNLQEDGSSPLISNEVYVQKVLPFLETAILTRRYEVRIICLRLIPSYIQQLLTWDPHFIQFLFEELLIGLDDVDDDIYIYSLRALIYLIPFLIPKTKEVQDSGEKEEILQSLKSPKTKPTSKTILGSILRTNTEKSSKKINDLMQPAMTVVENIIIPHILKLCVNDDDEKSHHKWKVLDDLIWLWKKLSVDLSKKTEFLNVASTILRCFQVIMRVMEPNDRIDFFCKKLCGGVAINDNESSIFIPKLVELGIVFLNDDNKHVRHEIGQTLIVIVTVISSQMDKTPIVSRKRDKDSLKNKLRDYYQKLERLNSHFPHTGPRYSSLPQDTTKFINGKKSGKIYIEGPSWNEEWNDEIDSVQDAIKSPKNPKDIEESPRLKNNQSSSSIASTPIILNPAPNMKAMRENSSDIADLGLGDLGTWEMHDVSL